MIESVELNVHMKPDPVWAEAIAAVGALFEPNEVKFGPEPSQAQPHVTVYMARFPRDAVVLAQIQRRMVALAATHKGSFTLEARQPPLTVNSEGWGFLNVTLADDLKKLHDDALKALNPLRQGLLPSWIEAEYKRERSKLKDDPKLVEMTLRWGSPYVGERYDPHATFAKVAEPAASDAQNVLAKKDAGALLPKKPIVFDSLALGLTGPAGTVIETLFEVKL